MEALRRRRSRRKRLDAWCALAKTQIVLLLLSLLFGAGSSQSGRDHRLVLFRDTVLGLGIVRVSQSQHPVTTESKARL